MVEMPLANLGQYLKKVTGPPAMFTGHWPVSTERLGSDPKMRDDTSMHSSRMRTARLLPVSPSMHCGGSAPGGVFVVYPSMQWGTPPPSWADSHL